MARDLEDQIDALYKVPLGEFTAARQALAKTLSGEDAARVKSLTKPHAAAWAANQVYWQSRPVYDRLVRAAERLRSAHKAALTGRTANLRDADDEHRAAVQAAVRAAVSTFERDGRPASAAMREALSRTMAALPTDTAPGRLERPLSPSGFEALAGIVPSGKSISPPATLRLVHSRGTSESETEKSKPAGSSASPARSVSRVSHRQIETARRQVAEAQGRVKEVRRDAREAEARARQAARTLERARAVRDRLDRELNEAVEAVRQAENESRRLAREAQERASATRQVDRELATAREQLESLGGGPRGR